MSNLQIWVEYSTIENCCDPLYLWVIKTFFWRRCRGALLYLLNHLGLLSYYHHEESEGSKTNIFPSKRRGGKELASSSALDSPSVMSKLATPPHAINSDMSQVIGDATSAMDNAYG